jgi:hypothetical protein
LVVVWLVVDEVVVELLCPWLLLELAEGGLDWP